MILSTEELYRRFKDHPVITTDSRDVPEGSIFFALKGERFDGNQYASSALDRGAAWAVVDDPVHLKNNRCLLVKDALKSLQDLALIHRSRISIPVLAITGTNGKTTTKELVSSVLGKKFRLCSTQGNLNNHIGVPLTLLRIRNEDQLAVIEMGANHPGEIGFLCEIAHPDLGLITNAGKAHLEGFGGIEGVVKTKTELYRFLQKMNGKTFVNIQDNTLMEHSAGLERMTYGLDEKAWVSGKIIPSGNFVQIEVRTNKDDSFLISSNLFGEYNALNILAAACTGKYFSVSNHDIRSAIEEYRPVNNRSQVKKTERNTLILDSYNANPSSMQAVLKFFEGSSFENKTLVLGDMLELGPGSDEEHIQLLKLTEDLNFREVYLVGSILTRLNRRSDFLCFGDAELAKLWFNHHPLNHKTILLKGSHGVRLETLIDLF